MTDVPASFPDLSRPPVNPASAAVYVHFPYCGRKCPYCDFNVYVTQHNDAVFADAILRELDDRGSFLSAPGGLASLYFGGGTPTRWSAAELGRVVAGVRERFGFRPGAEITVEANPEDASLELFEEFRAVGVNRFSVGCQSFVEQELRVLGRRHSVDDGVAAVRWARASGARVSLDLIYGLPGQSAEDLIRSLRMAVELETDHVSAYVLTVEPETPLARRVRLGTFKPLPDDTQAAMMEKVSTFFESAGLSRYEVSSFARNGRVAIHNNLYWLGGTYLGLGAGAHSYLRLDGHPHVALRRENVRSPDRYLTQALGPGVEASFEERLNIRAMVADRAMVVFRSAFGLDLAAWSREYGAVLSIEKLSEALGSMTRQGFLQREGTRWRPTTRGFLFNDAVARGMVAAVDEAFEESDLAAAGGAGPD